MKRLRRNVSRINNVGYGKATGQVSRMTTRICCKVEMYIDVEEVCA
jgi:hypothetical protein